MTSSTRSALAIALLLSTAACSPAPDDDAGTDTGAVVLDQTDSQDIWTAGAEWAALEIPGVPTGARMAVLDGNPAGDGAFVMRIDFPDGFTFPPHTHPTDEHLTILEGTFRVGMGNVVAESSMQTLGTGAVITAPAGMAHYATAEGRTIVQINGRGPFAVVLVDSTGTAVAP